MKKVLTFILKVVAFIVLSLTGGAILAHYTNIADAGRENDVWVDRLGTYVTSVFDEGRNVLIRGANKYLNFGTTSGTSGYGFRDNGGTMQFKDNGGSWADFGAGGGSGTVTSVDMTVPTGLTISGNPITTSGTLALSLTAGYLIPLSASTTAWNGFYNTPSGRITAGDGLTWSTNTLNFDGGNTPAGDLGGTWASPSVTDDSHAHTGSTISGVDISDDTNLTAGDALTLTGDDIDFDGGTAPGGELGGTWGTPTIDDSLAVTSWNLTTPTITTNLTLGSDTIDDFTGFGMALSTGDLGLLTTGAIDGECLVYESTGPTIDWVTCGGGVAWDTISDATANGSIGMAEYTQTMDWDTGAVTSLAGDYLTITSQNDAATDVSTQRLLVLENKAASTNAMEVMQRITNSDAVAVVTGLLIDGAGAFTTAIDLSAAAIGTALALGSNDVTVGGVTLSSTELSYLDGVTSAIQTQIATLGVIAGQVWTGVHDFGGATSLEIPNGTGPTVDATGECALDTTDDQFKCADSAGTARVFAHDEFRVVSVTIASTSLAFTSGQTLPALGVKDGIEITQYRCYVVGGTSKVINLTDGTNDTETITCATTMTSDTDVATNDTFTADELGYIEFGASSGSPNYLHFEAWGRITAE